MKLRNTAFLYCYYFLLFFCFNYDAKGKSFILFRYKSLYQVAGMILLRDCYYTKDGESVLYVACLGL